MDSFKRVIAFFFLLQVFTTQTKGYCKLEHSTTEIRVVCKGDFADLKSALEAVKGGIDSATTLIVSDTRLCTISANTTTRAFKTISLLNNPNLENIDPSAFAPSASSAKMLKIHNSPGLGNGVWTFASRMTATEDLGLNNVGLTEVPANAFKDFEHLRIISLLNNSITTFEASLAGLNLIDLALSNNKLRPNSFSNDVFKGVKSISSLSLMNNPDMTQLEKAQFEGLLANNKTSLYLGSRITPYMKCIGADWLCRSVYYVNGYSCADSTEFRMLSDYCQSLSKK